MCTIWRRQRRADKEEVQRNRLEIIYTYKHSFLQTDNSKRGKLQTDVSTY